MKDGIIKIDTDRDLKGRFLKGHKPIGNSFSMLGKKHTEETKRKMSKSAKGKKFTIEHINNLSKSHLGQIGWNKGKKRPEMIGNKFAKLGIGNWQGGITSANDKIRHGIELKLWRETIFIRDNWICQKCSSKGGEIQVHHILNFAKFIELRFEIDNGITLCKNCHNLFHKKYGIKNNTKKQVVKWIGKME